MQEIRHLKGFVDSIGDEIVSAVASTPNEDRDGETVNIEGWDLDNFMKNPVLLWSHKAAEPPIGRVTKIWREGEALKFNAKFAEKDPFAQRIYNLVKQKILNSFSVGFMVREADDEGNSKEQELLEISMVNVPANADARMATAYKSLIKDFPERTKLIRRKPEETEETIRIPTGDACQVTATINISVSQGIKALYCGKEKKIRTYLFNKAKGWTMEKAKAWVKEHHKIEVPEIVKEKVRLTISSAEDTVNELKSLLKIAVSPKKENQATNKSAITKVQPKADSPSQRRIKALRRIKRNFEILLSEEKAKRGGVNK